MITRKEVISMTMHRKSAAAILMMALAFGLAGCKTAPKKADTPRNYVMFFPFDSADLSPEAHAIVDQAAAGIKLLGPSTVAIAGFSDKIGTVGYNQHLSERRVAVVEQALTADGVDPKLFLKIPLGDSQSQIEGTGDRRVEIRLSVAPAS